MRKKKNNNSDSVSRFQNLFSAPKREKIRFIVMIATFFIVYALLLTFTSFSFRYTNINLHRYQEGDRADSDITVAEDIIYTDEKATETKKRAEKRLVPPVFKVNEEISTAVLKKLDQVKEIFTENRFNEGDEETLYLHVQAALPDEFSSAQIEDLALFPSVHEVFPYAEEIFEQVLTRGIINPAVIQDIDVPGKIEVWHWKDNKYEKTILAEEDSITPGNIGAETREIARSYAVPENYMRYIHILLKQLSEINAFYDEEETEEKKEELEKGITPVQRKLSGGELIVRKGELINESVKDKINIIINHSKRVNIYSLLGVGLFLVFIVIITIFLFRPPLTAIRINNTQLFILLFLYILYILVALVMDRTITLRDWLPLSVLLPTALFALLVSVIINTRISFYFVLTISLTVLIISKLDLSSFIFAFFSGVIAIMVIKNAEKRIELVQGIFILSALNGIIMIMLGELQKLEVRSLPVAFGWGVANGFASGIINLGILPLFEQWLNIPTRFRLLELSDTNNPVLKKMLSIAPGTYSHSLNVANMAEAACKEISANPLLARVGAYYHDIGKIDQAEYFIENQKDANKLVDLKPSLSVSVIKSHVKIGIEKAKELKLPKAVLEIISQHHGSGLINYFYAEALKNDKNAKINKEDYSYSEPIPTSKEAAVVMLADTVEAAVRTLKKPTVPKISKYVWDLFMYKIKEQQLNNSELTLKDLEIIKNTFVHILAGYFHARIEYPQTDGNEN